MSRHKKITVILQIAVFLLIVGVYLLTRQPVKPAQPVNSSATSSRYWIITNAALKQIVINPKARAALSNDTIYSPSYNPNKATAGEQGLHIIPAKTYRSESQFASDVNAGKIPSYVKAILYDNEPWKFTPSAEKQDPALYYKRAFSLAHAHGYVLIAAPVPNKIDPSIATYADVIDVQAQYAQATTTKYLSAVEPIIKQIQKSNPKVVILSGLSTNPTAGDPTSQQLLSIVKATFPKLTSGWWLNIPNPGTACPKCNLPRPGTAVSLLGELGAVR